MNVRKFKGKLIEMGLSMDDASKILGVNRATVYRKLQDAGRRFTVGDVHKLVDALGLSKEEAAEIFLAQNSRKCELDSGMKERSDPQ